MKGTSRTVVYFNESGSKNTDEILEIVHRRLQEGGIRSVVVASSGGGTGLKFAKRMAGETNLVIVSSHVGYSSPGVWDFDPNAMKEIEALGGKIVKQSHMLSGLERDLHPKILRGFSFGGPRRGTPLSLWSGNKSGD